MAVKESYWKNKKVLISGHTGFKGAWLCLVLKSLGADVYGISLEAKSSNDLFNTARVDELCQSFFIDIRNKELVSEVVSLIQPDIVFHLAAQSLVLDSYEDPHYTYEVNVLGTLNVLNSLRGMERVKSIVVVTSDKCYENKEWLWPYRETDTLGGHDPYSSSKACTEILVASFRNSFLRDTDTQLATVRAGNVIGGGDWAQNRIVPDFFRALQRGVPIRLRNPGAIRPWQHVLDPLFGYLLLAEKMISQPQLADAWNFGPNSSQFQSVESLVNQFCSLFKNAKFEVEKNDKSYHEACLLTLDSSKSIKRLQWESRLNFETAVEYTADWYRAFANKTDMQKFTLNQITKYLGLS